MKFKIAANTVFQLLGKAVTTTTALLATILIAKNYGPEEYGNFTLITTFVGIFYLIVDFGMNAIVLEKLQKTELQKEYFKNLLGLRLLWSIFLVFLSLSILSLLPQEQGFNIAVRMGIIIYSITLISHGIITTCNAIFQKNLRYDLSALSSSVGSVINILLVIFFATQRAPLVVLMISFVVGGVISAASYLFLVKAKEKDVSIAPSYNFQKFREIFISSLPLGITLIFNLVYFRADTFILALFRNQGEVGNYGLAYRFFEAALVFPTFFMNALYPFLLSSKSNSESLKKLVSKSFRILLGASIITTIIIIIAAPQLIYLSSGSSFTKSSTALRLLSLSFPSFFLSSLYMWVLITLGKRKILSIVYGTSMILNILLNIIFIPAFGVFAAAIITGLCETLILVSTYLLSKKYLKTSL